MISIVMKKKPWFFSSIYFRQNGQCSLTTVTGYKQEDGKTFKNQCKQNACHFDYIHLS
jgi:hypothetical protein